MGLPGVEVREETWSDHVPAAPYNSIISIGAFEHFARPCSRPVRVRGYRDFFERCHGWLNPGGWMSLQSIGFGTADRGIEGQFVAENISPKALAGFKLAPLLDGERDAAASASLLPGLHKTLAQHALGNRKQRIYIASEILPQFGHFRALTERRRSTARHSRRNDGPH